MSGHRRSIRAVVIGVPIAVFLAVMVVAAGLVLALPSAQSQGQAYWTAGAGARHDATPVYVQRATTSVVATTAGHHHHRQAARARQAELP
jgi:hypothetical protein